MTTPFTVPHFRAWAAGLVLDTGDNWRLEPFQAAFLKDLFSGYAECWLVVPEGNAKTTLAAGVALYHAQYTRDAMVTVAASSREQANWLFLAADVLAKSDSIKARFKVQEGTRRIRCDSMGSRIQIFAADDRTGDGSRPTLAILEELHRHRDLRLYRTWRGKIEKRGGQLLAISTAGEPEGEFEEVRKKMRDLATETTRRGAFLRAAEENSVLHEYAVPEDGDPDHIPTVLKANPLKSIDADTLRRKKASRAMTPSHWRRFVCGMPARMNEWVEPRAWDKLRVDIGNLEPGDQVAVGIRYGRGVGLGIASLREDERVAVGVRVIPPAAVGRTPFHLVEELMEELSDTYDVVEFDFDGKAFGSAADVLTDQGYPMEQIDQTAPRLAAATATLWRLISGGLLMHDGDPELRRQVLAGQTKESMGGWRLDPTPDTNALIALAMACHEICKGISPEPLVVVPAVG